MRRTSKVRGKCTYLYRALDKLGNTIDFYLSPTRNAKAAKRFLGIALNGLKDWEKPSVINTDKAPTYGIAISELKAEGNVLKKRCIDRSVSQQYCRSRSRQAQAVEPPRARIQDVEDGLRDHYGV